MKTLYAKLYTVYWERWLCNNYPGLAPWGTKAGSLVGVDIEL